MGTKTQNAKSRKANAYKKKRSSSGVKKSRKSFLNQVDTTTRPEQKNVETVSTMVPPLTATFCTPQLINGSAQGSAQNEHVGRKAIMKKVQLRYIYNSGSAGGQQSQVRILVVYDKQANGALPSVGDVLASSATYNSFMNLANSDRFVVLCDEICDSTQSSQLNISGSRYIKCNLETIFGGTTSGISSINSGSIFIMAANNSDPTIGSSAGTIYFTTRVRYTDV